ncbi:hypothetical protein SLEP1_g55741 [Rubroshorea leprosula]|uniref:Uncharacterized protein n=1 Tax=Rubroshorea leprosula TaxID=152421 RepID=A0AAV5MK62_9ROSI|nr:hypothetical protein SLEP1_g55741 [Rubroshorea leprosula]
MKINLAGLKERRSFWLCHHRHRSLLSYDGGSIEEEELEEEEKDSLSVSSQDNNPNSIGFSLDSLLIGELSIPANDVAGLEWVSQFVDDSLPEFPPLCSSSKQKIDSHAKPKQKPVLIKPPCFLLRAPAKARTKRPRTSSRV